MKIKIYEIDMEVYVPAKSHSRGNEIYCKNDGVWKYSEDDSIFDDSKPCKRCGNFPNKDGSDFCVGNIDGVTSACCGHGVDIPFVMFDDATTVFGKNAKKYFKNNKQ